MRILMMLVAFLPLAITSCSEKGLSSSERLERDEELIMDYLQNNNLTAERDESGLYYDIVDPGTGQSPNVNSFVEIRYKGYFLDNTVFDETEDDEDPLILPLNNLPTGLQIGLDYLQEGGRGIFYLPGLLGNGEDVLVFDVTLLGVHANQAEADDKKIVNYLERKGLEATRDETGLYYNIDNPGTGLYPVLTDEVEVRYKGYLLNDAVFDETQSQMTSKFILGEVIEGWQIGVQMMEKESTGTLYIPSALGYGPNSPSGSIIPANSVLVFDIELVDFKDPI